MRAGLRGLLQALLEEMQIQVENRERTLQNLTKSLRNKDCQLQEYISMASEQEVREGRGGRGGKGREGRRWEEDLSMASEQEVREGRGGRGEGGRTSAWRASRR